MGYDMTMVEKCDEPQVPRDFRLNGSAMDECLAIMSELGMLKRARPGGPWPDNPFPDELREPLHFGIHYLSGQLQWDTDTWREAYGDYAITAEEWEQARQLWVLARQYRAWHDATRAGMSFHKFTSNDGWIVTPEEIRDALRVWDAADEGDQCLAMIRYDAEDWFPDWIAWLRVAQAHGGIAVY